MHLITKESILKGLPKHYRAQYPANRFLHYIGKNSDEIATLLENEDPLTEERAVEVIGNKSWTTNECNECRQDVQALVQLGQEPDYESSTANICFDCLQKALLLLQQV